MSLRKLEIIFMLAMAVAGSLLHFVYQWSGNSPVAACFAPVNESTWEHLKLLFFPALLFTIPEAILLRKSDPGFPTARLLALLVGLLSIIVTFYTYSGILGFHMLSADILTFLLGVAVTSLLTQRWASCFPHGQAAAWLCLVLLCALFILFTFFPPQIGLFEDPVRGGYGIPGKLL